MNNSSIGVGGSSTVFYMMEQFDSMGGTSTLFYMMAPLTLFNEAP